MKSPAKMNNISDSAFTWVAPRFANLCPEQNVTSSNAVNFVISMKINDFISPYTESRGPHQLLCEMCVILRKG